MEFRLRRLGDARVVFLFQFLVGRLCAFAELLVEQFGFRAVADQLETRIGLAVRCPACGFCPVEARLRPISG